MAIIEDELDCVIAYGFHRANTNIVLAQLQRLLPGPVTAHLRRRRIDTQILERQLEGVAVERDLEDARFRTQLDGRGAHFSRLQATGYRPQVRLRGISDLAVACGLSPVQRMYLVRSSSFTSSPRCLSTYSASTRRLAPVLSAAS